MAKQEHGSLPYILGLVTLVSGFVDAVTYIKFGHVFVANMTGNVVFTGFALAGTQGIWVGGSLLAVASPMTAGRLSRHHPV